MMGPTKTAKLRKINFVSEWEASAGLAFDQPKHDKDATQAETKEV